MKVKIKHIFFQLLHLVCFLFFCSHFDLNFSIFSSTHGVGDFFSFSASFRAFFIAFSFRFFWFFEIPGSWFSSLLASSSSLHCYTLLTTFTNISTLSLPSDVSNLNAFHLLRSMSSYEASFSAEKSGNLARMYCLDSVIIVLTIQLITASLPF